MFPCNMPLLNSLYSCASLLQDQMQISTNAIYKAAAQLWKPWLQPEALLTLSQGNMFFLSHYYSF